MRENTRHILCKHPKISSWVYTSAARVCTCIHNLFYHFYHCNTLGKYLKNICKHFSDHLRFRSSYPNNRELLSPSFVVSLYSANQSYSAIMSIWQETLLGCFLLHSLSWNDNRQTSRIHIWALCEEVLTMKNSTMENRKMKNTITTFIEGNVIKAGTSVSSVRDFKSSSNHRKSSNGFLIQFQIFNPVVT